MCPCNEEVPPGHDSTFAYIIAALEELRIPYMVADAAFHGILNDSICEAFRAIVINPTAEDFSRFIDAVSLRGDMRRDEAESAFRAWLETSDEFERLNGAMRCDDWSEVESYFSRELARLRRTSSEKSGSTVFFVRSKTLPEGIQIDFLRNYGLDRAVFDRRIVGGSGSLRYCERTPEDKILCRLRRARAGHNAPESKRWRAGALGNRTSPQGGSDFLAARSERIFDEVYEFVQTEFDALDWKYLTENAKDFCVTRMLIDLLERLESKAGRNTVSLRTSALLGDHVSN